MCHCRILSRHCGPNNTRHIAEIPIRPISRTARHSLRPSRRPPCGPTARPIKAWRAGQGYGQCPFRVQKPEVPLLARHVRCTLKSGRRQAQAEFHSIAHVSMPSLSRSLLANALACSNACSLVSCSDLTRRPATSSKWKNLDARPSARRTSKLPHYCGTSSCLMMRIRSGTVITRCGPVDVEFAGIDRTQLLPLKITGSRYRPAMRGDGKPVFSINATDSKHNGFM